MGKQNQEREGTSKNRSLETIKKTRYFSVTLAPRIVEDKKVRDSLDD